MKNQLPNTTRERALRSKGFQWIAGMDEVGRGSLAGPLVAAAVILKPHAKIPQLRDSKMLSHDQRQKVFLLILGNAKAWGIGMVPACDLDHIGLSRSLTATFHRALFNLNHPVDYILIDGRGFSFSTAHECIIDGDQTVASIAAASIIAKVFRDHVMTFSNEIYPEYGFRHNKGYGTALHLVQLKCHRLCPIHRKSFSPVSSFVQTSNVL